MELARARELLPRVIWRESSPSTNAELRELAAAEGATGAPHGTLLATTEQTAGRGRLGRGWVMPPDTCLAASLLIRGFGPTFRDSAGLDAEPEASGSAQGSAGSSAVPGSAAPGSAAPGSATGPLGPGWAPLLAGAAVAAALQPCFGDGRRVGVKWPNDVHVRDEDDAMAGRPGRKLCGILCELLPDGAIVVGTGLNLLIPDWELPTERATSLLAAGADVGGAETLADAAGRDLADRVVERYAREMLRLADLAGRDPEAARARVLRSSLTLGAEVRVHLPGGEVVDGRARALAPGGELVVDLPTGGELTVAAGDVEHLR